VTCGGNRLRQSSYTDGAGRLRTRYQVDQPAGPASSVGLVDAKQIGLFVVNRLRERQGLRVEVRSSPNGFARSGPITSTSPRRSTTWDGST